MKLRPCGDVGVLAELEQLDDVLGLYAQVAALDLAGVVDLVPAAHSLLVTIDPRTTSVGAVARRLEALPARTAARPSGSELEVPVVYDGEDLDEVGELTGLGARGVVDAHVGQVWTVAFSGFAPGFGYLVGEDPRLRVPRRRQPRSSVPAGAVALADGFSGVYPRRSPGGWQLIGRTALEVWDADRDPPALLLPGARVRFVVAG